MQAEYSMVLYGRPGRVVTDHLQLIWTPLLSDAALQTVEAIGVCHWQPDPPNRLFFYPYSRLANPFGSLWKRPLLPVDPAPSYSWVEVSHCAKQTNGGHTLLSSKTLPWFYFAHGSGVSLNVGRTAAIDLRARPPHCNVGGVGAPSADALRRKLRECVGDIDALDSIQLLHDLEGYSDEERSVVILLSTELLSETQSLTHTMSVGLNGSPVANTSVGLMCGRWPDLFPCNDSNPSIDYMSRCSSTTPPLLEHAMRPCGRVRQFSAASVPSPPPLFAGTSTLKSIYWLHIPKTSNLFATTALTYACGESVATSSLKQSAPPILEDDCQGRLSHKQCCSSAPANHTNWFHDPLPWPEIGLPNVGNVVMLLREPRQRILSAYFHLRTTNGKCCGKGWGWTAPSSYSAFRAAALHANSTTFLALPGASGCQTKMLVGRGCMDSVAVTSQEVDRAVSFIRHTAAFVGIVEEYNASVCLWHERFGGSIVSSEEVAIQLSSNLHPPYDTSPASMGGFVDRADEQTYNAGVLRFHLELSKTHKCDQVAQR